MNTTRTYNSHKSCTHASSKQARAICRKENALVQTPEVARMIAYVTMKSGVKHIVTDHAIAAKFACTKQDVKVSGVKETFEAQGNESHATCKNCVKLFNDTTTMLPVSYAKREVFALVTNA